MPWPSVCLIVVLSSCSRREPSPETMQPAADPGGPSSSAEPSRPKTAERPLGSGRGPIIAEPWRGQPLLREPWGGETGAVVQGPRGTVSVGPAHVTGGQVPKADRTIAGMRAGFRACYNRGLAANGEAQGRMRLVATLDYDGHVIVATVDESGSLSEEMRECVQRRVWTATFSPPDEPRVDVSFDIEFTLVANDH